jgi:radical SAM superfamily enzyme YgiQ (UPF0313 family)
VAALLPAQWNVRLIDRNAEELTEADLSWADLAMTGGMVVQQHDTLEIIRICKQRGLPVAVGGPDVTASPHVYANANFQVRGEAEGVIGDFINALNEGAKEGVFESPKFQVDVTKSPIPRFDLLNFSYYLQVGVQFSRGCPFTCEFCDIIELYGRVPRAKTNEQMLRELDALYRLGWRGLVEFVDDNLIGNKKALKAFLPELTRWLAAHRQPFEFGTEASINLADDDELLHQLREANFHTLFIGIESPEADTLIAAKKKQNTRRDIAADIRKIHAAGMTVMAGFIIGFDTDKSGVVRATMNLIEDAAIAVCLVSLLAALPHTQRIRRLHIEGRLHPNYEMCVSSDGTHLGLGLNFDTLRPRSEIIRDCQMLVREIYHPQRYFARVRQVTMSLDVYRFRTGSPRRNLELFLRTVWHTIVLNKETRLEVLKTLMHCLRYNPRSLRAVLKLSAMYLHLGPFSRYWTQTLEQHVAARPGA